MIASAFCCASSVNRGGNIEGDRGNFKWRLYVRRHMGSNDPASP